MSVGEYISIPIYQLCYITRISLYAASVQQSTHTVPVLHRILLWVLSESSVPELFTHTSVSILPAQKHARWSAVFGDAHFTARTVVNETPWGWVPKILPPSLSDRVVPMRDSTAIPALLWGGNKPDWTVGIHSTRSTQKSQNPRSRFLQTCRFPWSKLYPDNFWPMLSVLIPESIRSMIKLWPPQNHSMFEVGRNLWRWFNPTFLLRAKSAGAAC